MESSYYYNVKFKEQYDTDKGPKWKTYQMLVSGVNPGDAEAKVHKELEGATFEITGITVTKYIKVLE